MKLNPMTAGGFGPNPWLQTSWDWRAAGNFICGGMGSGLLIATALFDAPGPHSLASPHWQILVGLALVGLGLFSVWLEIGRPLRALHVFLNPRTSWMTREAFVGALLFPCGLAAAMGLYGFIWITAVLAMGFLYCQSRMLPAARGIPAWRSGVLSLLMVVTGWCEGAGIYILLAFFVPTRMTNEMFVVLLLAVARWLVWRRYRQEVDAGLAPTASRALHRAGRTVIIVGTVVPVALMLAGALIGSPVLMLGMALASACVVWAGANMKYMLITRASYNQGFALTKLPVRGVRA